MQAEAEPGKLGSYFSFYFYLGTHVCYAEAPGGHTAFPSWNQIPSEHDLPFPITVPDLWVEDSITRGTGTSSWLLVRWAGGKELGNSSADQVPKPPVALRSGALHHRWSCRSALPHSHQATTQVSSQV